MAQNTPPHVPKNKATTKSRTALISPRQTIPIGPLKQNQSAKQTAKLRKTTTNILPSSTTPSKSASLRKLSDLNTDLNSIF